MCREDSHRLKIRDMRKTLAILANRNNRNNLGIRVRPPVSVSGAGMKSKGKLKHNIERKKHTSH